MLAVFKIDGMSCGGCVASVERAVRALSGVESVSVRLADATAQVQFDAAKISGAEIRSAIEEAGYDVIQS